MSSLLMPAPPEDPPDPIIHVERHRAERLAEIAVVGGMCCSSCCCCCCCVHAIGGVVGAAAGSARALAATASDERARRGVHATNIVYWSGFLGLSAMVFIGGLAADSVWIGLLVLAFGAPALQLLGSAMALPFAAAQPAESRRGALAALRDITVGSVLGAIIGVVALVGIGALLVLIGALT